MRKIKTVNKQTVGDYVQEESRPVEWGGPDQWQFQWEPGRFDGVKMPPTLFKASVSQSYVACFVALGDGDYFPFACSPPARSHPPSAC